MKIKTMIFTTFKLIAAFIPAIIDGKNTDLHIDKPVYAIHLEDVIMNYQN